MSEPLNMAWPVEGIEISPLALRDGTRVDVWRHRPKGSSAGPAVLYCHGIQSHPGWFVRSADRLAQAGCDVFQVTRRGSGAATVARGDCPSYTDLLDDITVALEHIRRASPGREVALVGVSWGGKLLAAWCAQNRAAVRSLTMVAPGIAPLVGVSAMTKLAIGAAIFSTPARLFDIPLDDVTLFTENPAMQQYLQHDAHQLRQATARFLFASNRLDRVISSAADGAIDVPACLILARRERIVDNPATRAIVERLTGGAAGVVELDGAHTLEFEPDPTAFFQALARSVKGDQACDWPG